MASDTPFDNDEDVGADVEGVTVEVGMGAGSRNIGLDVSVSD